MITPVRARVVLAFACTATLVFEWILVKTLHILFTSKSDLHGVLEGAEVAHLSAKHKVTQLRVCEKDDEEHDRKSTDVFGALKMRKHMA